MFRRLVATAIVAATTIFVTAAPALAHDGGRGLYGEANDKVVTNAGFLLIIFFPTFVFLMTVLQSQLEKRKYRRIAAAKARDKAGW